MNLFAAESGHDGERAWFDLLTQRPLEQKTAPAPSAGGGMIEDLGSFGVLENGQRAVMLEIRHANGNIDAFSYPLLESAGFNPSDGILLTFSSNSVKLIGRNLNQEVRPGCTLFESIVRHCAIWITEADESRRLQAEETEVLVEKVEMR